jgi:hypothetical protein
MGFTKGAVIILEGLLILGCPISLESQNSHHMEVCGYKYNNKLCPADVYDMKDYDPISNIV